MPTYTVQQGECLVRIAARFGFRDYRTIYNDPQNADFRQIRPNPYLIFPGDQLYIPDKESKTDSVATGNAYVYQILAETRVLRIALEDVDGKRLAGLAYKLEAGDRVFEGKTGGDGLIEQPIPPDADSGSLTTDRYQWQLDIAHLNPVNDAPDNGVSGYQARLRNLGYDPGPIDGIVGPLTEAAVRGFQEDNPPLAVDGVCGPETLAKLVSRYGC